MHVLNLLAAVSAAAILISCGGGGGSDGATAVPATFSLVAAAGGASAPAVSVSPGGSGTIELADGQAFKVSSTQPITVTASGGGAAVDAPTVTPTSWSSSASAVAGGSATLTIALAGDASQAATIKVNVAPRRFDLVPRRVDDEIDYDRTDVLNSNETRTSAIVSKALGVAADGSYTTSVQGTGADEVRSLDPGSNFVSRVYASNDNRCTFTPLRENFRFPLYVGQAWTTRFDYACALGYRETGALSVTVEAYEPVTVPIGTVPALRIRRVSSYTGSNDPTLTNGSAGAGAYQSDETCWWDPSTGREVKCIYSYAYTDTAPAGNVKSGVQSATYVGNR